MLIARYTANASGVIPTFNEGYQYTVNETSSNGIYTVELYSDTDFTSCSFAMKTDLLTVEYLKVTKTVTSLNSMFANCYSLTSINCSDWDTSNVINMNSVFLYCEKLTELDVSSWDTSNVGTLNRTFYCCLNLKSLDLSNWKTTNVVDISYTFSYCSQTTELNLSGWNVDKVTNTTMTFAYCNKLDTIKIYNCKANMISTLNWSSYFPTEVISGKTRTIYCDEALVGQIEPPTNWVLSSGKESNIKVVEYKFNNTMYNLIPEFNEGFTYTYEDVVEGNVTTRTIYSYSLPTLMRFGVNNDGEFGDNKSLSLLEVLSLNADNLNTCQRMFKACENVKSINCENVTINNAYEMFAFCCSLNTLNVSSYNMSNATNINNMFYYCNNLTSLDISNWSLNDSVSTSNLFDSCLSLNSVIMNNSDCVSVNKIISQLPTKSSNSMGTLYVAGVSGSSQINTGDASIKYWNVSIEDVPEPPEYNIIARYTANASGVLPIFNDGYKYTVNETVSNGIYTVELSSDDDFTSCMFNSKTNLLTVEYLKVTDKVTTLSLNYYGMFDGCSNLTSVNMDGWDTSGLTSMEYAFYDCKKLVSLNGINNLNINNVKNMYYLFYNCSSLTQLDLSNWNTKNVTNMGYMFNGCSSLAQLDISNWDTSNVSSLAYFFNNCSKLNQITATNVSTSTLTKLITALPTRTSSSYGTINANNTTDELVASANAKYWNIGASVQKQLIAEYKFDKSIYENLIPEFNAEFTNYEIVDEYLDTEDIVATSTETMMIMNYDAEPDEYGILTTEYEVENISTFSAENIVTRSIYSNELPTLMRFGHLWVDEETENAKASRAASLISISYLNTNNLTNASGMFRQCANLIDINCDFNTSKVTNMSAMFQHCSKLTSLDLSNFNTSNVTLMNSMFASCSNLTALDVNNFDTNNVINMQYMFYNCNKLTSLDLSNFNTSNATNIEAMFQGCQTLTSLDVSNWDVSKVKYMKYLFYSCVNLTELHVDKWDTSNVTDMGYTFNNCQSLKLLDLSKWNTSKVYSFFAMFENCKSIENLNLSNFKTNSVANMSYMFKNCNKLTSLDVSNFDTSNATNMEAMFQGCQTLTSLNVSNWDTNKVTTMYSMFGGCESLTQLDVSSWDTSNVTNMYKMFIACYELESLNLSGWDMSLVEDTRGMFDDDNELKVVSINNSHSKTINKIIARLPERSENDPGVLYVVGSNNLYNVKEDEAIAKNWNIVNQYKIAEYKFNNTLYNLIPEFNEGFTYTYEDENIVYEITISDFNWELGGIDGSTGENAEFSDSTIYRNGKYIEVIPNTIIRVTPNTGQLLIDWYDENKIFISQMDRSLVNEIDVPDNAKYFRIWGGNIRENITELRVLNSITTRTIYSNDLPTLMSFGAKTESNSTLSLLEVDYLDTSNLTTMYIMFCNCRSLTSIGNISNWDTSNVTDMSYMFKNCSELTQLDVSNWNTSNVTDMYGMFNSCSKLTQLDLSNFDTSNVTDMRYMFYNCNNLTSIDVSNFDTSKVTDIGYMFYRCYDMQSINVSNWNTDSLLYMNDTFRECTLLENIEGINDWNTSTVESMYCTFYWCKSLTSLDLSNWDTSNVDDMEWIFSDCISLRNINISGWTINENTRITDFFDVYYEIDPHLLTNITMNNSDYNSVNRIISELPTLTSDSMGTLDIAGVDDISQVDTVTAESKFWNVESEIEQIKIAEYKFDGSLYNLIPDFNDGFIYTYEDKMEGNMIATNTNWESGVPNISTGIVEQPYGNFPTAKVSDFIEVNPSTTYYTGTLLSEEGIEYNINVLCWYWYDENKTYIDGVIDEPSVVSPANASFLRVCIEESDLEYNGWTLNNVYVGTNTTSTITRTIYTLKNKTINIKNDSNNDSSTPIPPPEVIDDIIQYPCSEWEVATFDLSEYAGKNVDISFTITAKTETWCEFGINKADSYETICAILEPDSAIKIFDYNTTIENIPNDFKLVLEGMNGIVSNINIIVEGENLFPSKLITEYRLYENMNCYSTTPVLHDDNTLEFTNHWRGLYVNIQDYKNMNLNVSFDIKGIPNDIGWSEFEYGFFNNNEQNYDTIEYHIFYDTLTEESNYHVEFDAMVTENTHFYLGGMGGHVENLKILADNNLPTKIRFSTATPESTGLDGREKALLEVLYLDNSNLITEEQMFQMCINLTKVEGFVSNIMHKTNHMFVDCANLTTLNIGNWDISNVQYMQYMFYGCVNLTSLDVSDWDTSNVTNMSRMFRGCELLTELDLSNWDTSNVTTMELMFYNCESLTTLGDLSDWDVSNVNDIDDIFAYCSKLESLDLSKWDVGNVVDMYEVFYHCHSLKSVGDLSNWNVSNSITTNSLFDNCWELTSVGDLSNWDTKNMIDISWTFRNCYKLESSAFDSVSNWDVSSVNEMQSMFEGCDNLIQLDLSNWDTSNITNMESMFENCNNLTTLDLSNFDTSNVTGMKKIFADCHNLSALDLSNWDTSNITDFTWLFTRCYNLTSIGDINNWDTSNVDCFDSMFFECNKLSELDLSSWDTSNVTDMGWMFHGCTSLNKLNISNWNTNSVTYIENIFTEAAINDIIMNNSDYNSVNKVITQLPTRTSDSMGILNIVGIGDISQIDKNTADSKYWRILIRTKYNVKADKRFKNIKVGNRRVKKISLGGDVYL